MTKRIFKMNLTEEQIIRLEKKIEEYCTVMNENGYDCDGNDVFEDIIDSFDEGIAEFD